MDIGLCDFSDAYIVVTGQIAVTAPDNDAYDKKVASKNNAPFTSCFLKINNKLIDNGEDIDLVMPMYNLIEYNKNKLGVYGIIAEINQMVVQ